MRTDGQTDMTKIIVAFRTFAIAPEKKFDISIERQELCFLFFTPNFSFDLFCRGLCLSSKRKLSRR